ncbi:MAG: DUF6128 domain-containing protein [Clostridium sp.]
MSNYQRLISYIYAYEGGIKGKNIGFAKLEEKNDQCKITISVKKIFVGGNSIGIYLLSNQGELQIGTLFVRNGVGEFRTVINSVNIEDSGRGIETFYGLSIHDVESDWRTYTTIWEDAVAHAAELELADVTSENLIQKQKNRKTDPNPIKEQPLPISKEIELELELEEKEEREEEQREREEEEREAREEREEEQREKAEEQKEQEERKKKEGWEEKEEQEDAREKEREEREEEQEDAREKEWEEKEEREEAWEEKEEREEERVKKMNRQRNERSVREQLKESKLEPKRASEPVRSTILQRDTSYREIPNQDMSHQQMWEMLQKKHTKILAFDYEDGCQILLIKPQDIGLLPRDLWVYGNNSFLLHGYYNYRYLILAKLENPNGSPRYLLGVPGTYVSNEKYMASMFGFPNFVLSKKQPSKDGRFGYWYTDIKIGD